MAAAARRATVTAAVLSLLWTASRADTEVVCVFMDACVLPCGFQNGSDVVLRWTRMGSMETPVHAYDFNARPLESQDGRFAGRTSLFEDQVPRGNASLRLSPVQVQDEGRYHCYVDTSQQTLDSFVTLRVDAPVQRVALRREGERITCSSEDIYPEPNLTWSVSPSRALRSTTIVQRGRRQLYNISSTLRPARGDAALAYTCTISTRSNHKQQGLSNHTEARIAIAQVAGVVLVAVIMGLVPCFYQKCKKLQGSMRTTHSAETRIV